ncbi:uncharacterized protein YxjI [Nakamurella sp. UYEF19]|uniref:phospholipid scramblase-related protein n=1 Tax=Nakamurella sp. UYEF19 TaxID=1756392 RepID=UPI0033992C48
MTASVPAGWYPDPSGAQDTLRWWDGTTWSGHTQPTPSQVPPGPAQNYQAQPQNPQQAAYQQPYQQQAGYQQQASTAAGHTYGDQSFGGHMQAGGPVASGYRSPMTEANIFVSQKRKIIEVTNEYAVFAQDGGQIGSVTEVGQSTAKKALRVLTSFDQFMTHRLEVRDMNGQVLIQLTRPAKVFKSTLIVQRADGAEVGRLVQRNVFGKIRFGLEANGQEIGSLNAENWRAWNFSIQDHTGAEIARITKTWEGLMTTLFTSADKYMVQIHRPLTDPLLSLVVASALTVDTALKQDAGGFN